MSSAISLNRPLHRNYLTAFQNTRTISSRFVGLHRRDCFRNVSLTSSVRRTGLRHGSSELRDLRSFQFRVSSEDASLGALPGDKVVQAPSFAEFITSERVKVVAMLALALALCNADRVVMSVAIVPLSLSRGWSRSFSGIVQVVFFFFCHSLSLSLTHTHTHMSSLC
jgi:hypothetical protein